MNDGLHDAWEFENRVNRLRGNLEVVPVLLAEVSDVMLSIGRRSMSLAPGRGGDRPLPGGRALVVLGPVSDHATETDDVPHPVTVVRRVADVVREWMAEPSVVNEGLAPAIEFLRESARWVVAHEELAVWVEQQLDQVLGLLRSLTGDTERVEPRTFDPEELEAHMLGLLRERPAEYRMTPAEAEHFWPGISDRVKAHRSRARARAKAESKRLTKEAGGQRVDVEPVFFAVPDAGGRYSAEQLAEFHEARGHDRTRRASRGGRQIEAVV